MAMLLTMAIPLTVAIPLNMAILLTVAAGDAGGVGLTAPGYASLALLLTMGILLLWPHYSL